MSAPLAEASGGQIAAPPVPAAAAPPPGQDLYVVEEDKVLTVDAQNGLLAGATDLKAILVTGPDTGPRHGTLVLDENGSFVYTPDADYFGGDEFTYVVEDATGARSDPATAPHGRIRQRSHGWGSRRRPARWQLWR
jgi:hypothetical protein